MIGSLTNFLILELIPDVTLSKPVWIGVNWFIIAMFVTLNLYITYEVSKVYGAALTSLFTGTE
jgi:hypothetical protein